MPDAALRATEKQFIDLLAAAAGDTRRAAAPVFPARLPRGSVPRGAHIAAGYADLDAFQERHGSTR